MNTTTSSLSIQKTVAKSGDYSYTTYRLTGYHEGARVRRQFTSEAEAKGEKLRMEISAANAETQVKPIITRLNPEQVADAEAAMRRLNGKPLSEAVDWYLATYTAPLNQMSPDDALKAFLADRKPHIKGSVHDDYDRDLSAFLKAHRGKTLMQITTEMIIAYLDARKVGKKTWNNLRGEIGAFFEFCKKSPRRWVKDNPVEPIPTFKISRGLPEVLTAEGAESLMRYPLPNINGATDEVLNALCNQVGCNSRGVIQWKNGNGYSVGGIFRNADDLKKAGVPLALGEKVGFFVSMLRIRIRASKGDVDTVLEALVDSSGRVIRVEENLESRLPRLPSICPSDH